MGVDCFDQASVYHFIGGIAYRLTVFPDNVAVSFLLSMFIHLFTEAIELPVHPITGGIETDENHQGDIFCFLLGWYVGCFINPYVPPYSKPLQNNLRFWLLILVVIFSVKEVLREVILTDNKFVQILLK